MHACVKLILPALRQRLSREAGRNLTNTEVFLWLAWAGFTLKGDWHCDGECSLKLLHGDEILAVARTPNDDGFTFVSTIRHTNGEGVQRR
jgi:hypothetical protein